MSYDQKPSRIKLVSNGGSAAAPESETALLPDADAPTGTDIASQEDVPDARAGLGLSPLAVVVFLCGCIIGGVSLAAWPHLAG